MELTQELDELASAIWWGVLDEDTRSRWMAAGGNTGHVADAWAAFKEYGMREAKLVSLSSSRDDSYIMTAIRNGKFIEILYTWNPEDFDPNTGDHKIHVSSEPLTKCQYLITNIIDENNEIAEIVVGFIFDKRGDMPTRALHIYTIPDNE